MSTPHAEHGEQTKPKEHDLKIEELEQINCNCQGCMDGRPVLFKAKKVDGKWEIKTRGESAAAVVEAKLPGGALGFIAVLEKVAHLPRSVAIEITTSVLRGFGMEPQFHIDNDHGNFDIEGKSDAELAAFVESQTDGCGFAGRIWSDEAHALIADLKNQGWLVEVLGGHHCCKSAVIIDAPDVAINVAKATNADKQAFTYNRAETRKILTQIAIEMGSRNIDGADDFVNKSLDWFDSEFAVIANALRQISNTSVIEA